MAYQRLEGYLSDYQWIFRSKTKKFFDKAQQYTRGLFVSHLRNIEQISDTLGTIDYFQLQHFITESNWDAQNVIDLAAKQTSKALPKRKLTGLIIDETGTVKKGEKSVGVGWQYCGNVGKTANSQVCVIACLSNGDHASMVDARLYLPKNWVEEPDRCREAGIPESNRVFKTKLELAYDILLHQCELGTIFDFVSADGYYGNDLNFGSKINNLGLLYMLDIHRDQPVYLERPELFLPPRKSIRGREPKRLKATVQSIKISDYCKGLQVHEWHKIKVRNTAKGTLADQYHFAKVFVWNKEINDIENRLLVIRKTKTKSGEEIKYSFTNAEMEQYTEKAIAYMQAQRFFIEHCIRESKQVLGLSQFQTRKWLAWHHQIALNIMTMCFMLKEKLYCFADIPLLSARDIREWLCFVLSRKLTEQAVLKLIIARNYRRQNDINRAYLKESFNVSK
ncbi:MAG: IS701 family transposase [Bacteroidales bacterium]|nr:IS701 family transposase [Bacteroidales bacterium]